MKEGTCTAKPIEFKWFCFTEQAPSHTAPDWVLEVCEDMLPLEFEGEFLMSYKDGSFYVHFGDYIVQDATGEAFPMSKKIFHGMYEVKEA